MKFNNFNRRVAANAQIGKNVKIGDNTVIYDNVKIGDNSIICNNCVIGEPLQEYYETDQYVNPDTVIGDNCLVRSHSIIYAGCKIGNGLQTGHRATIRENTSIGNFCRVGTSCDIQGYSRIGNHCWFHSNVFVAQKTSISNFVFIYPHCVLTDDPTPPSNDCIGPTIDDFAQIGSRSIILPGVSIGKHALIGAGSIVTKDISEYMLALGSPAKIIKDVRTIISRATGRSHYPWPENFERGMPWKGQNFSEWNLNYES